MRAVDMFPKNVCLQHGCIKCCLNTEMPVSDCDVARLRALGFCKDFFVVEKNGWKRLRNSQGRCVFHDGRLCTVYSCRPRGCRIYPVVFDPDSKKVGLDSFCPRCQKFQVTPRISDELMELIQRLDFERNQQVRNRNNAAARIQKRE